MMNIFAGTEEGDEVNGRTSRAGESNLESDALQKFLWNREERGGGGEHGCGRGRRRCKRESGEHKYIWKLSLI
jgi:hypothetical protein